MERLDEEAALTFPRQAFIMVGIAENIPMIVKEEIRCWNFGMILSC